MLMRFADAQIVQTARIDIPVGSDAQSYSAISLDVSGILLYRNFTGHPTNVLEVIRYDTSLKQTWQKFIPVPRNFSSIKSKVSNGNAYFLFGAHLPDDYDYHLTVVDTTDGYAKSYTIKNAIKLHATDLATSKEAVLIGGYIDYRPIVLRYSVTNKKLTLLPGISNQYGEIAQLLMYPEGESDVVISSENSLLQKCLWVMKYNKAGELIKSSSLIPNEGKNLIFGRTAKNKNNTQVVAGVYSYDMEHPQGIFTSVIDTSSKPLIHYYNFGELKNFFKDRSPRHQKHIKDVYKHKELAGEKTNFRHHYIVQNIIPAENKFIMINEAFYPSQFMNSRYYQNAILRDRTNPAAVNRRSVVESYYSAWKYGLPKRIYESGQFVSYHYTHALVIGLAESGKLEWDNLISTEDMEAADLEENTQFLQKSGTLFYLFDNTLNYQRIKMDSTLSSINQEPIKTLDGQEIVESHTNNTLRYWYGDNFFVFGTETLHRHTIELEVHKVFFINKLRVH